MEHNPTDISLQEVLSEKDAEKRAIEEQTRIGDFKWIVGNKRGRRIFYALLEQAGVFRLSFTPDPCATAFNEGQRNIGLTVLAMFQKHAPESYALMLSEHDA